MTKPTLPEPQARIDLHDPQTDLFHAPQMDAFRDAAPLTLAEIALRDMYAEHDEGRPYPIAVRREYRGVLRLPNGEKTRRLVIQHYADGSRLFVPKDAREPWAA